VGGESQVIAVDYLSDMEVECKVNYTDSLLNNKVMCLKIGETKHQFHFIKLEN
jgi:hypothetical protein